MGGQRLITRRRRGLPRGISPGGPDDLCQTRSLARVIAEARGHPVHIVFVHGIRTSGPGSSLHLRQGLCRYVSDACPNGVQPPLERSERFDMGPRPTGLFLGTELWRNDAEWRASWPFVDRYVFRRPCAPPIIVDEVNWWPLVFMLKCRILLEPETSLAGADKADLELCARSDAPYYPFIDQTILRGFLRGRSASGGGACANAALKQQLVDWGLGDVAIALGPMSSYFHGAMEAAFAQAAAFEQSDAQSQEFVVVSESLGSFLVLDAFANLDNRCPTAADVVARATDLYFFANQFTLLELSRLPGLFEPQSADPAKRTHRSLLHQWAATPIASDSAIPVWPRQIIAFNDPSDVLTFDVPALLGDDGQSVARVVNLYCRNEFDWFHQFANPIAAHTGYSRNSAVMKTVFAS